MQTSNLSLLAMQSLKTLLLLTCISCLFTCCQSSEVREVKATVICMTPLTETSGAPIPESLYLLLYPAGGCEEVYYRLLPTFVRLDDPAAVFEPKLDAGTFSGNKNNPRLVERVLQNKILPKIKVGEALTAPYVEGFDKAAALQYELQERETENYYLFFANDGRRQSSFDIYPVYTDTDSLRARIGDYYCENQDGGRPLVIVLNPPVEKDPKMPAPNFTQTTDSTKNQSSGKSDEHSKWMSDLLNKLGDVDRPSSERQAEIKKHLDRFVSGTDVKIYGANGTLTKMTPIEEYLYQISYYKTLDRIDVQEVMVRDSKIWEVRLIEYHQ